MYDNVVLLGEDPDILKELKDRYGLRTYSYSIVREHLLKDHTTYLIAYSDNIEPTKFWLRILAARGLLPLTSRISSNTNVNRIFIIRKYAVSYIPLLNAIKIIDPGLDFYDMKLGEICILASELVKFLPLHMIMPNFDDIEPEPKSVYTGINHDTSSVPVVTAVPDKTWPPPDMTDCNTRGIYLNFVPPEIIELIILHLQPYDFIIEEEYSNRLIIDVTGIKIIVQVCFEDDMDVPNVIMFQTEISSEYEDVCYLIDRCIAKEYPGICMYTVYYHNHNDTRWVDPIRHTAPCGCTIRFGKVCPPEDTDKYEYDVREVTVWDNKKID